MSGTGKFPSFEPDEEAKAMIESMFEQKQGEKKQAKEEKSYSASPTKRRVKIPEPLEQTKKEEQLSLELVKEELDVIHDAFLEFSEQTSDTVVYGYLYNEILRLTEAFQDMEYMINDAIKQDELTHNTEGDYEQMQKIRRRVLSDAYSKYKKGK